MRVSLVLTVIGNDKPGIVESLSGQVTAAGANWEESRMAHLAGKFAGLLRVSVEADRADALERALLACADDDFTVVIERSTENIPTVFRSLRLNIVGGDHPGIVRDISRLLARHQVNIMELETDVETAAMSGEPLFRAQASLRIPPTMSPEKLRGMLEALAHELMVDVAVETEAPAAAS